MDIFKRLRTSRVLANISWVVIGRVAQMLISFIVGILTARYLGPSNYGLISYAGVYTGFFTSVASLGLNSVIVKELIDNKERQGAILGTVMALKTMASGCCIAAIVMLTLIIDRGEQTTNLVVFLCSLALLLQATNVFEFWFQSRLESKLSALAALIAYAVTAAYRVILLVTRQSVEAFAIATSIDYACITVAQIWFYRRRSGPRLSFSRQDAARMLKSSCHFMLSNMMVAIYGNTDKFMIKHMLGSEAEVGYYSIALTLNLTWTFVLTAIIDSFNPIIMESRQQNIEEYRRRNQQLYGIIFYISTVVSLGITILAKPIIGIMYGEAYAGAVSPLRIITWYTAFSYLGVARNAWIVCEGKQKYLKYLYGSAVVLNILFNYILIPPYGPSGAAVASLATQIGTSVVLPLMIKPLRENSLLIIDGVLLKWKRKNSGGSNLAE